ncbi:hypothetical protein LUZ63_004906 [Rhynchospora breviuscula]|uniref:Pectinesterase n=1 Tax=Rhynchospora breviuscula TaxID=2022672 RepID=A0A9Q0CN10_9POAL|nr:hypothetical protein LUZ63_004906 [Rhynchospora breviuscula]
MKRLRSLRATFRRHRCPLLLLLLPSALLLILFTSLTFPSSSPTFPLHLACRATPFPSLCLSLSFPPSPSFPFPLTLLLSSLSLSHSTLRSTLPLLSPYPTCQSHFILSSHRLSAARASLTQTPKPHLLNSRAYLSAGLLYQYDCSNYLSNLNKSTPVNPNLISSITHLASLTSNSLSLLSSYIRFGSDFSRFAPPSTERQGFFEEPSVLSYKRISSYSSLSEGVRPNATVCKSGFCDYNSIQDAITAAPDFVSTRYVIHIKSGTYKETIIVPFQKTNVHFIGDGMGKTVITGELNAQMPNLTTIDTATVTAIGDGFRAHDITFENSAGAGAHQAVAFRSDSDRSVLEFVEFRGHQDTLYARSMRQFYRNCYITGTVDFIFGNSAALFYNCTIETVPRLDRPEKGAKNIVTAHGRTNPAQATGFVFHNCRISGSKEYMVLYKKNTLVHRLYLGRPWKEFARTVFIGCYFGEMIMNEGWLPWRGEFALGTLYYGEYGNWGPGADTKGRVEWSSQVPKDRLHSYSVENFIQGHEWIQY